MTTAARALLWILIGIGPIAHAQSARLTHAAVVHKTWKSSSEDVGHLAVGAVVTVTSHRAGYSHIQSPAVQPGWVYSRYLEEIPAGSAPVAPAGTTTIGVGGVKGIASLPKPPPVEANSAACPNIGRSTVKFDTETNLLKNRVDEGTYTEVPFKTVLALPWQGMPTRRYSWKEPDKKRTADYEGAAVSVTGYLVEVAPKMGETTNCGKSSDDWVDWHVWLVETVDEVDADHGEQKLKSIVVETTPRVRRAFPDRFDIATLREWARDRKKVKVSGWLMLDPEHPTDATGTPNKGVSRGTIWEIHPVMKIELANGGNPPAVNPDF